MRRIAFLFALASIAVAATASCTGDEPVTSTTPDASGPDTGSAPDAGGGDSPSDSPAANDAADGSASRAATLVSEVTGGDPTTLVASSTTAYWLAGGAVYACGASCSAVAGVTGATSIAATDTTLSWRVAGDVLMECTLPACSNGAANGTMPASSPRVHTIATGVPLLFPLSAGHVQRCGGGTCGPFISADPQEAFLSAHGNRLIAATTAKVVFCTASNPGCTGSITDTVSGISAVHVADLDNGFVAAGPRVYQLPDNVTTVASASSVADFTPLLGAGERIVDLAADIAGARMWALVDTGGAGARLLTAALSATPAPAIAQAGGVAIGTTKGTASALLLSGSFLYFAVVDASSGTAKSQLYRAPK